MKNVIFIELVSSFIISAVNIGRHCIDQLYRPSL